MEFTHSQLSLSGSTGFAEPETKDIRVVKSNAFDDKAIAPEIFKPLPGPSLVNASVPTKAKLELIVLEAFRAYSVDPDFVISMTDDVLALEQIKAYHYGRNSKQSEISPTYSDLIRGDYEKLNATASSFHMLGFGDQDKNVKWIDNLGYREFVFKESSDGWNLVNDDVNLGTYNFAPPSDASGHLALDVFTWILFANSDSDFLSSSQSGSFDQRLDLYYDAFTLIVGAALIQSMYLDGDVGSIVVDNATVLKNTALGDASLDAAPIWAQIYDGITHFVEEGDAEDNLISSADVSISLNPFVALASHYYLNGNGGNDILLSYATADRIDGGSGTDTVSYVTSQYENSDIAGVTLNLTKGEGYDGYAKGDLYFSIENVIGSYGADVIVGSSSANQLSGIDGADEIFGEAGNDTLFGGAGQDYLDGGANDDILNGGEDADTLLDMSGNNTLNGDGGADILTGRGTLNGGAGDDILTVHSGTTVNTSADGGDDIDEISFVHDRNIGSGSALSLSSVTVNGITSNVGLSQATGYDAIEGALTLLESGHDSHAYSYISYSTVTGNWLDGYRTNYHATTTSLSAEVINVHGHVSNDLILFTNGTNYSGGGGTDKFVADWSTQSSDLVWDVSDTSQMTLANGITVQGFEALHLRLGVGNDVITGGAQADYLNGGVGDDNLNGGGGADTILGGLDDDYLDGGAGNDTIIGGEGADTLYDLSGDNMLFGNEGVDNLTGRGTLDGGAGNDILTIHSGNRINTSADGGADNDEIYFVHDRNVGSRSALSLSSVTIDGVTVNVAISHSTEYQGIENLLTLLESGHDGHAYRYISYSTVTGNWINGYRTNYHTTTTSLFAESINIIGNSSSDLILFANGTNYSGAGGTDTFAADWSHQVEDVAWDISNGNEMTLSNGITLANFERVHLRLGDGDDFIMAGGLADYINGGAGDDVLNGAGGNDIFVGGLGDDTIIGGSGSNTYIVSFVGHYSIELDGLGRSVITDLSGNQGQDTLENISTIILNGDSKSTTSISGTYLSDNNDNYVGSQGNDTISGLSGNDLISAGEGDDIINGNNGNDYLRGDGGADELFGGAGNDYIRGGAGADTLNGGAGTDWADYITSSAGVTVNLLTNTATGGDAEGDEFAFIERVYGSSHNDHITGDNGVNYLRGWSGDDQLFGGAGNDYLQGGLGADALDGGDGTNDWAYYFSSTTGLTVNLGNAALNTGEATGDTYANLENLLGSKLNDNLTGDENNNFIRGVQGDDMLYGGAGNDFLRGDQGADLHDGGDGVDWAYYVTSSAAITIDLGLSSATGGDATGDTFTSIERVYGSRFNDSLTGDSGANYLRGAAGDDFISGDGGHDFLQGDGGADILNGGEGSDWAYYASATTGITIDFSDVSNNTGEASGDSYNSVENIVGGRYNDIITGDSGDNYLRGFLGNDTINGGAGDDILRGEAGADTFVFEIGTGSDAVIDYNDAEDMLDFSAFGFADATDALSNAVNVNGDVVFTIGVDVITIENTTINEITDNLIS